MPQLVAFNRRWAIGSDDFVFPGLIEILLRTAWLIAISVVFHLHKDAFDCTGGHLLKAYYIGLLTLLSVSIVMTAVIVYHSMQGTITNLHPRRRMNKLIYVKLAISLPELVWNILGTYWAFGMSSGCELHVVWTVKGAVLSGWVIAFIVIIGIIVVFDPLGGKKEVANLQGSDSAKRVWEVRCKLLCCCVGTDEQSTDAFSGIAKLFSNFFQGVDLVPTDIAAGLILVHREQERKASQLSSVSIETNRPSSSSYETFSANTSSHDIERPVTEVVHSRASPELRTVSDSSLPTPKPWMTTDLMHHYMKFAMASYGWPLFIFTHLVTGACQLWSQCKCCSCMMKQGFVKDDNCCRCNTSAIRKTTGIHQDDIIYASFHNEIYETPFFLCVDREQQTIVIAVRGTLSLKDAITDLTADSEPLEIDGLENCIAHKGILQAAKYVKATIEKLHLLEQAFERAEGAKIVITGHSLGAGTAALLAILLRPKYPDLKCFTFSPPGGLMSLCASRYSQEFTCSVILGKDLVPRLGLHTMEDLKTQLLTAIHDCDMPKYKLFVSGVWQALFGSPDDDSDRAHRPLLTDRHTNTECSQENRNLEAAMQDAIRQSEQHHITHPTMYPPGQIMHILEIDTIKTCCGIPDYYAVWSRPEDFSEVLVSPKMLSDHFPDAVMRSLEQLSSKHFTPRLPHTREIRT